MASPSLADGIRSIFRRKGLFQLPRAHMAVLGSNPCHRPILCVAASPACGTGNALYDDGIQYGIDPVYALAFFRHESSYGKYGIAATNKGLGNIRCSSGYQCKNGFRAYTTWQAGYDDWYKLIRYYVDNWHKSTIYEIIPTYAPSSENDTQEYIQSIEESVSTWRKQVQA